MPDFNRTLSIKITQEQYQLLERTAADYDLDLSKLVRFILFDIFIDKKFLSIIFERKEPNSNASIDHSLIVDDVFSRLEKRDDEYIKMVDHFSKEMDYFRRICLAQYNLLGNIGYRLCQKGYEKQYQEFLDEIKQRFGL